jgi:hypothetical protein
VDLAAGPKRLCSAMCKAIYATDLTSIFALPPSTLIGGELIASRALIIKLGFTDIRRLSLARSCGRRQSDATRLVSGECRRRAGAPRWRGWCYCSG